MDARLKSLPQGYIERLQRIIPPGRFKAACDAMLQRSDDTFRINTLRADENTVLTSLKKDKAPFERAPLDQTYFFKDISRKKIEALSAYRNGWIYLQNLASQFPPILLDPQRGEKILDLCAAPGGKTSHICALIQARSPLPSPRDTLTAVEPEPIRFQKLVHTLNLLGANVETVHTRGETFVNRYLELMKKNLAPAFDRILVDAPCSGDGTFDAHHPATYYHWSEDFVQKMHKLQLKLLRHALSILKPGGTLVYSTCAVSPEENEMVIDVLLTEYPRLKIIPPSSRTLQKFLFPPLKEWHGKNFHPQVAHTRRILPSAVTEGFFVAMILKPAAL